MINTDKKDLILSTASNLFISYGIQHITMDDIANDCGISKKTIYKHFQNKKDLVHQTFKIKMLEFTKKLAKITLSSENAIIELSLFFHYFTKTLSSISPTLIKEIKKDNILLLVECNKINKMFISPFIQENLIRGKKELLYKPNLNIEEINLSTNTLLTTVISEEYSTSTKNISKLINFLKTLLMHRFVTTKGIEFIEK